MENAADTSQDPSAPAEERGGRPPIGTRALLLAVAVWGVLLVPLGGLKNGWLPRDDARRHAAFVESERSWGEIVLLRSGAEIDLHPGWHHLLRGLRAVGIDSTFGLVRASAFLTLGLFLVPPLLLTRWHEAWLATLCLLSVFEANELLRIGVGRPFGVSVALLVALGWLWRPLTADRTPWKRLALLGALFACATWMHGNPYLWALPILGFALAAGLRVGVRLSAAVAAGVLVAAIATGAPIDFLWRSISHPFLALGSSSASLHVSEFLPFSGSPLVVAMVLGYLAARRFVTASGQRPWDHPYLVVAALGWALGFLVSRFWNDWALPALCVWVAQEIESALSSAPRPSERLRLRWTVLLATVLVLSATHDGNRRWSRFLSSDLLDSARPEFEEWLPGSGGILYNDSMSSFFDLFFANPTGEWRYAIGFEPSLAPDPILETYRAIRKRRDAEAYRPWVDALRPADRLAVTRTRPDDLGLLDLEWKEVPPGIWIGRLRRGTDVSTAGDRMTEAPSE